MRWPVGSPRPLPSYWQVSTASSPLGAVTRWRQRGSLRGYLLSGQIDDALRRASEALDLARRWGERGYEVVALRVLADIAGCSDPPHVETAILRYREATMMATELGMRPLAAHCHLGLGKLYRRAGKREQALELLTTVMTMYREMGMTYWLEKAEAEARDLAQ